MQIIKHKLFNSEYIKLDYQHKGHLYLYFIKNDLHKNPYMLLEDLYVKQDYRKQGIGGELIKTAINFARKYNCYKIVAMSRFSRGFIHNWYQELGFKKFGYEFRMDI